MIVDPNDERHLIASEGKVIARIGNMKDTCNEIWLGYHTDKDGVRRMDRKSDFTEIRKK